MRGGDSGKMLCTPGGGDQYLDASVFGSGEELGGSRGSAMRRQDTFFVGRRTG